LAALVPFLLLRCISLGGKQAKGDFVMGRNVGSVAERRRFVAIIHLIE
jgi:hypothetical protein